MRANWGPGTHLTTACRPFLQGMGLLGIDSWAWHSDREFSVPRQWTFSTQNPFFFAMRLNLKKKKIEMFWIIKISFTSYYKVPIWVKDGNLKNGSHSVTLLRDLQPWYPKFSCKKKKKKLREEEKKPQMVVSDLRMHLLRPTTQTHVALWGHQFHVHPCADRKIYCHICCAFYIWAGPHTGVFAATWNVLGGGLNRIDSDADSIKEMNRTAMNKTFVFVTRMTCPCGFCGEGNVGYVDDFQEECAGGVLARQRWFVSVFLAL